MISAEGPAQPERARRRAKRRPDGPLHLVQLAQVLERYYRSRETKSAIAKDLGLSRFKVARLLDEALEMDYVRIAISLPESELDLDLSEAVRQRFGLRQAVVIAAKGLPPELMRKELGAVAGSVLAESVDEEAIVGIAWGRTLDRMAASLPPLPRCTVVQVIGGVSGVGFSLNSHDLVRRVATRTGGEIHAFHAPLIAPDASTARSLERDPEVAAAQERYEHLTCAVVAIGSWDPMDSMMARSFAPELRAHFLELGVVADIGASLIDRDGQTIRSHIDERRVAIRGAQLRAVPEIIAVAGGIEKAQAIRAALVGGWVTTLVTDADVADALCR